MTTICVCVITMMLYINTYVDYLLILPFLGLEHFFDVPFHLPLRLYVKSRISV